MTRWEGLLWLEGLLFWIGTRSDGAKLSTGELSQGTLEIHQRISVHLEVVLGHSIRTTPTRHEAEFSRLVFCSELSDAVVGPAVDFQAIVEDHDGLAIELDGAVASEVAHIRVGNGMEF